MFAFNNYSNRNINIYIYISYRNSNISISKGTLKKKILYLQFLLLKCLKCSFLLHHLDFFNQFLKSFSDTTLFIFFVSSFGLFFYFIFFDPRKMLRHVINHLSGILLSYAFIFINKYKKYFIFSIRTNRTLRIFPLSIRTP